MAAGLSNSLPLILLAEDLSDDVFFMRRALAKVGIANPLFVACDGRETIDYLSGAGPYADREHYPLPTLLLLDIHMPLVNGFEVLAWLQTQPQLDDLAVVVLSGSNVQSDIQRAKQMGADDYRLKPAGVKALVNLVQELHARWLTATPAQSPAPLSATSSSPSPHK